MIVKNNVPLSKVSWLSTSYKGFGHIKNLFYPENINELVELLDKLIERGEKYIVVGHTSNLYFMPNYVCSNMISTKMLNKYRIEGSNLICECGVKVSTLAKNLVKSGFKGFEGLIDMPGTIAGGLYGNAGCYGCNVADNLVRLEMLNGNGEVVTVSKADMMYSVRSSALKRNEMHGFILRAYFHLVGGDKEQLIRIAEKNHEDRKNNQPSPAHNLGSVYVDEYPSVLFYIVRALSHVYGFIRKCMGSRDIMTIRKNFELRLVGGGFSLLCR